jgi:hypothetical protein
LQGIALAGLGPPSKAQRIQADGSFYKIFISFLSPGWQILNWTFFKIPPRISIGENTYFWRSIMYFPGKKVVPYSGRWLKKSFSKAAQKCPDARTPEILSIRPDHGRNEAYLGLRRNGACPG